VLDESSDGQHTAIEEHRMSKGYLTIRVPLALACGFSLIGYLALSPVYAAKHAMPTPTSNVPASIPAPSSIESLKPTSAVVLTYPQFETWWNQHVASSNMVVPVSSNGATLEPMMFQDAVMQSDAEPKAPDRLPPLHASTQWVNYTLKIGDVISVQLLGHPELSQKGMLISPDGALDLPLIGTVMATGISLDDLRQELGRRFGYYLKYPDVTVTIDKVGAQRAYVMGAIKSPGIYLQDGQDASAPITVPNNRLDYRLSALLAKAGGILADADLEHIQIFNAQKGIRKQANILNLLAYGDMNQDMLLEPEDVVYVPRLPDNQWSHPEVLKLLASSTIGQSTYPVRVYGLVTRPDVYQLPPGDMTLQTVLAKAGLDVEKASRHKIFIARTLSNRQMITLPIDATRQDTTLYPNDVVIVSKGNWEHGVKDFFNTIGAITGPAANVRFVVKPGITQTK
jgi:protein involved in polysaccharide export with SLBB domain